MPKYRKRDATVEVITVTPEPIDWAIGWVNARGPHRAAYRACLGNVSDGYGVWVDTVYGGRVASPGYKIVFKHLPQEGDELPGGRPSFHVYTPEIFEQTYELEGPAGA